jgi:peroxiredoxin
VAWTVRRAEALRSDDVYTLPADLPVPADDGACDHLPGRPLPALALPSTRGGSVRLDRAGAPWAVVYCYPRTGLPDRDPPGGLAAWDAIPGMRGCTPQACSYRDHHAELRALGAEVYGVSTQTTEYQREAAQRLHLPYPLLSDASLELARALELPTWEVAGHTLVRRLTLIARAGRIEACFYPVFPPDADATRVVSWLGSRRADR